MPSKAKSVKTEKIVNRNEFLANKKNVQPIIYKKTKGLYKLILYNLYWKKPQIEDRVKPNIIKSNR